jgi:hypothetical protein
LEADCYSVANSVVADYLAFAAGGIYGSSDFWQFLFQILVGGIFISQATHQPAALARYFRGIQRQTLLFGHAYGNRFEFIQEGSAAKFASAPADAAAHFSLVANADLAHFNSCTQVLYQHFYQLPEIDTPLGGEKKSVFIAIERFFNGE